MMEAWPLSADQSVKSWYQAYLVELDAFLTPKQINQYTARTGTRQNASKEPYPSNDNREQVSAGQGENKNAYHA